MRAPPVGRGGRGAGGVAPKGEVHLTDNPDDLDAVTGAIIKENIHNRGLSQWEEEEAWLSCFHPPPFFFVHDSCLHFEAS